MERGETRIFNGATPERTKLLAIVPARARDLGFALGTVLQAVQNIELSTVILSEDDSAVATLGRTLAKSRPRLLLICANRETIGILPGILEVVRKNKPDLFVLAILEGAAPDELQGVIHMGAADFCLAPVRLEDLLPRIMRWTSTGHSLIGDVSRGLEHDLGLQQFLGNSRTFVEAVSQIPKLARCDASVLITGETGSGKEMCARAIHHLGPRSAFPFVPVNCGAIPSDLVENELFGHDAGAFTGATSAAPGMIHEAERGTLFLDEIDSLPLQTQVKFLRFLQDQEYRPLGARKSVRADIRIIAASNADLTEVVRSGRFRSDLYYRLNVVPLHLPALRERREDIPVLAHHFVEKCSREFAVPAKELSQAALDKLLAHEWPGNVRELENLIRRAFVLSEQALITGVDIALPLPASPEQEMSFKALKQRAVAEFEAAYIQRLLATSAGNISKAARAAKKNRRAFWELMRKHEIAAPARS